MYQPWVSPFLLNLERTGNVSGSARTAGISSSSVYALKRTDADFAASWDQAIEDHTDTCEQELTRRAFGYEEPVVYQGQLTPVWERDANGHVVVETYEFDGGPHERPVQARNADGTLQWLTVRKFSDTLLLARVKAYRRQYSTERTELTGADGAPVAIDESMRSARIAQLMQIAAKRKELADLEDRFKDIA